MKKGCLFLCLLFSFFFSNAFASMEMRCVSVAANGDATITWFNSGNTVNYHAYYIYHSTTAAGPFTLEDSILVYANQLYTDVTANAYNSFAFYYVVLKQTTGVDVMSDTLQAIKLSAQNIGNNGYATLNWNVLHSPRLITTSPYYKIYRKYTTSGWTLIDSVDIRVSLPTYLDEIRICSDTVKYRIEVDDNLGCTSVSNDDGDFFRDVRPPQVPSLDSVTVDNTGMAQIGWQADPSIDTKKYVVLELIGTNWVQVGDTLYGINSTFLQTSVDVSSSSQQFRVLAIDSCGNPSAMSSQQQTLFVSGTLNRCAATYALSWNNFINAVFNNPSYEVIMNYNGGPDSVLSTSTATSFLVTNLIADSNYVFRIRALLGNGYTSTSNRISLTPDLPIAPRFNYIRSVNTYDNWIQVTAFVDTAADIYNYRLARSASPSGPFETVTTIPATGSPIITFNDNITSDRPYYYRVYSLDSCGYNVLTSQTSNSIFLNVVPNDDYTYSLLWNSYSLWDAGVDHYDILRSTDNGNIFQAIATVPAGTTTYVDAATNIVTGSGNLCYRIMATEAGIDRFGFTDISNSNSVCSKQPLTIFIPSAFDPGSTYNRKFKPSESYVNLAAYHFKIYNRFGGLIFETSNPSEGWDGSYFGHNAQEGIYVYYLSAKGADGIDIKRIATFTLIR